MKQEVFERIVDPLYPTVEYVGGYDVFTEKQKALIDKVKYGKGGAQGFFVEYDGDPDMLRIQGCAVYVSSDNRQGDADTIVSPILKDRSTYTEDLGPCTSILVTACSLDGTQRIVCHMHVPQYRLLSSRNADVRSDIVGRLKEMRAIVDPHSLRVLVFAGPHEEQQAGSVRERLDEAIEGIVQSGLRKDERDPFIEIRYMKSNSSTRGEYQNVYYDVDTHSVLCVQANQLVGEKLA